ncbi:hypothetical protein IWX84_000659 [Flavobacterium sp. CG_9.10]|uniref:hypothetical protein n=1 Tax=Flavobacterium sp. CG_9.10 TaxID=2787729 RepID=UPI0018C975D7|nr:hypothetical protein [Flavobacterium sp. CG_9.10]MBG6109798.1 hypothetical protein [Flavobacterium sp. CG_9.10]
MKKIGIVITDGVGFRNFILSDFLVEVEKSFDEVIILSCLPAEIFADFIINSRIIELPVFAEKFPTWFFRKAKEVAHLKLHKKDNFGITDNLNTNTSNAKNPRGYATRLIFRWTSIFHSENWIQCYTQLQQWSFKNNPIVKDYGAIFEKERFDLLFFTHQRPPFIAPLAYQAQKMKLKTVSFIFSWDNLASKGRMAAEFDYFLVWSDLMKKELLHFYKTVQAKNIEIVGTPQFEPYVLDRYYVNKEEFLLKFELDPLKKIICFSCGDSSTSKNDALYIETIAIAILEKRILDVTLLVRTSPAEDPIRFALVAEKFPFVKWNFPKWYLSRKGHQEEWSQRVPTVEDVKDLRGILNHSDLNINMLSTMSLDFMQFAKPVINTVFGTKENGLYDDQRFLKYAHLINVVNTKATKIAKNEKDLVTFINDYLENPILDEANREELLEMQVSKPLKGTGKRIAETLLQWS